MFDTTERHFLSRGALLLLLLAFAILWFAPLDYRHLVPSDEGRYAEIGPRDVRDPGLDHAALQRLQYFEKPPLQTWANALTYAAFGIGAWQARLYTALTGFAGILLLGYTGTRVFNRSAGFFAALVLASAPYWFLMGHFDTLDMGLSFWMEAALCTLLLAQRAHLPRWRARLWMWACWASMALAVLSKGLIGLILPGAVLVLYTLVARDWALWKRLYLGGGLVIFFAICTPWFVLVEQRNPGFLNFFFIVQQFERYLTPAQNRPGPAVLLHPGAADRLPAVALAHLAKRAARPAPAAAAQRLLAGAAADRLDRVHLPVLQRLALEAALVRAAGGARDRAADRALPAACRTRPARAALRRLRGAARDRLLRRARDAARGRRAHPQCALP
ncbi:MAG: glycosyltransferase family 39 protein [Pararobbsia sp.]